MGNQRISEWRMADGESAGGALLEFCDHEDHEWLDRPAFTITGRSEAMFCTLLQDSNGSLIR